MVQFMIRCILGKFLSNNFGYFHCLTDEQFALYESDADFVGHDNS